jgi:Flp pilus assembly protein TadD
MQRYLIILAGTLAIACTAAQAKKYEDDGYYGFVNKTPAAEAPKPAKDDGYYAFLKPAQPAPAEPAKEADGYYGSLNKPPVCAPAYNPRGHEEGYYASFGYTTPKPAAPAPSNLTASVTKNVHAKKVVATAKKPITKVAKAPVARAPKVVAAKPVTAPKMTQPKTVVAKPAVIKPVVVKQPTAKKVPIAKVTAPKIIAPVLPPNPADLARKALLAGNLQAASTYFAQALKAAPGNVDLLKEYYLCSIQLSDWTAAVNCIEGIISASPEMEQQYRVDYGRTLFELRRYEEARSVLAKAVANGKDTEVTHKSLLLIAIATKDDVAAEAEYKRLLALGTKDIGLELELADLLWKANKRAEAIPHYKVGARNRRDNCDIQARVGYVLLYSRDLAGAATCFREAVRLNPTEAKYRHALSLAEGKVKIAAK